VRAHLEIREWRVMKNFSFAKIFILITVVLMGIAGCTPASGEPPVLTVMTHDSFSISAELVTQFEEAHQVKLVFVPSGDAGSVLNRAILTKDSPQADVLYGVDNTFLSRALNEGLFEHYASPLLEKIPDEYQLDPANGALPVDYGDVCINYDKAYFASHDLRIPQSLEDLTAPEYRKTRRAGWPAGCREPCHFIVRDWLSCWLLLLPSGKRDTCNSGRN